MTVRSFSVAGVNDIVDYIKPSIKHKPKSIIIHAGTNDIQVKSPEKVAESLIDIAHNTENELKEVNIGISEIIMRVDKPNLTPKIKKEKKKFLKNSATNKVGGLSHMETLMKVA